MQRIFLIGYMGAGKTTMGKELSKRMKLTFIDLDYFIEGRFHKTVRQLFEEKGEETFREIERNTLLEVADFENVIISTGGGAPCFHQNMEFMNEKGTTVYLKATVEELAKRVSLSKNTRPILKGLSGTDLELFITDALKKRSHFYEQADIVFDAEMMDTETDIIALGKQLEKTLSGYKKG
ncbi:MAG: shikimate kinase [Tannerella sp.]|jgi:shikimate kinase|nr:shikimate kinase [Tannerella sp.]